GDVARVGPCQVGVRALRIGEPAEGAVLDELAAETVVLLRRTVAPVDRLGRCQLGDLVHPAGQGLILGGRLGRGGYVTHRGLAQLLSRGAAGRRRPPSAGSAVCSRRGESIVAQGLGPCPWVEYVVPT